MRSMASSVLLVSLEGITNESVTELVQARGIGKVIVVSSVSGFNQSSAIAGINHAASLRGDAENPKLDVVLATPNGQSFEINPTTFAEISKLGLSFLNDPGLNSFTGGELIVSDEFLSSPSPNVNYTFETFDKNNQLHGKDFAQFILRVNFSVL